MEIKKNDKSASPESETGSKTGVGESADRNDSGAKALDQCATAQGSSKSTSTTAAHSQDATVSLGGSVSKKENESTKDSTQDWITHFLKEGHDLLWATGPDSNNGPHTSYWSKDG